MVFERSRMAKAVSSVVALTLVTGCATGPIEAARKAVKDDEAKVSGLLKQAANPTGSTVKPYTGLVEKEGFYFGGKRVRIDKGASNLPDSFKKRFTLNSGKNLTYTEIGEIVTEKTGVQVLVRPDVPAGYVVPVSFSGDMPAFLDSVAGKGGISWKMQGNAVVFYRMDTRTFQLNALSGDTSISATVTTSSSASGTTSASSASTGDSTSVGSAASSGSSSSSGTGAQTTTFSSSTKIWTEAETAVKSMLSKDGKVTVSPGLATITVTDVKPVLDAVETYVKDRNHALSRQVTINVAAYSVTLSNDHQNGIDWTAVLALASGSLSLASPFAGSAASSLTAAITSPTSRWNGTTAVLRALETQGKVSLMTSSSVTTLNAQPVPVQVAKQTGYLASVGSTLSSNGVTSTSLTPGSVTTGFNMNLLPLVFDQNRLLLQYAVSISDLANMTQVSSSNQQIQVPEINTRNFLQRASVKSGQTLVLSGFERMTNAYDDDKMIKTPLLGGGYGAKQSRDVIVILITPQIAEDSDD